MSKPIYVFFCVERFTEAWYQLSKEDQDALMAKTDDIMKSVGGKSLVACNSRWAKEETFGWGVEEYPDIDAYQKKAEEQEKLEIPRYLISNTILGTKFEA